MSRRRDEPEPTGGLDSGSDGDDYQAGLRALREALAEDLPSTLELGPLPEATVRVRGAPEATGVGTFGRYVDPVEVDRGGMGCVLRAIDPDLGRAVAVKVIRADHAGGALAVRRFLREARVTGQLEHPSIPPVHELGTTDGGEPYFAMKLIEGRTLAAVLADLERERPSGAELVRARLRLLDSFLKICDALEYAHRRGVVHRDLKPANLMLGEFGEVLVLDWGLARILDEEERLVDEPLPDGPAGPLTVGGAILGTPAYMSPEQLDGRADEVDARSDVYSLGAVLYEILTRQTPFRSSSVLDLRARVQAGGPVAPSTRVPDQRIGHELDAIVLRAMATRPVDRYPSVEDLRADVEAYLQGRLLPTLRYGPVERVAKWVGRHRAISAVLLASAFLMTAMAVVFVWRLDRRRREAESLAVSERDHRETAERLHADLEAETRRERDYVLAVELAAEAEALWPARPDRIAAMESWIARATDLVGRADGHRALLERLAPGAHGRRTQAELVERLDVLADGGLPDMAGRIETALALADLADRHRRAWSIAIEAVADPEGPYGGLDLGPQTGLVPLGADPASGLQEFAVAGTGAVPDRSPDGALVTGERTALVLVLLPGGPFEMGSTIDGPNRDPQARDDEVPVRRVDLDPFFLSRFEMTQGQWLELTGKSPSLYAAGRKIGDRVHDLRHPVENVRWEDADRVLTRLGLVLPTEARWEYGARGGTTTPWWTGSDERSLAGAENLADAYCKAHGGPPKWRYLNWLDDGHSATAPVGSYRPNAFGLHDTAGNVQEWCLDVSASYRSDPGPGDGLRRPRPGDDDDADADDRVCRGGSYAVPSYEARVAHRFRFGGGFGDAFIGLRPARDIER